MKSERLNLIVAVSAILISGASFYATFLQANSAEQQVKAMTWPLIEFTHGNYNPEEREERLTLTLKNAGVGPAIIKSVLFRYKGEAHLSLNYFLRACCNDELRDYLEQVAEQAGNSAAATMTTSRSSNIILPVGGEVNFLSLVQQTENKSLWMKLNSERWELDLEVCYCSLLENCYVTDQPGQVEEVRSCPVAKP